MCCCAKWPTPRGGATGSAATWSRAPSSHDPETYLAALAGLGCAVDAWETTYLQILPGDDAVLDWVSGTALRPILRVLDQAERAEFTAEYGALLREAYPVRSYGTLLPYRRIFAVARRE